MKASKLKPGMIVNINGYRNKIAAVNRIREKLTNETTGHTVEINWIEVKFIDGNTISLEANDDYDAFIG